ncbi:MAG: DUF5694 domain-containing protein [Tannerella sp.]|jgi:hypothetical protein|nr:DUF5694 domain-containing protein [Tannerella sp.]
MKKILFLSIFILLLFPISAQDTIPVLTLGTFHFNFPNLDRIQFTEDDQIDVLEPKYQDEINDLVKLLAKFEPTIIVIERRPESQKRIDSLYHEYLKGKYDLKRGEDEQIGFRLARQMGISKLYCVDEWGGSYNRIEKLLDNENSEEYINFEKSFSEHPDSVKMFEPKNIFKEKGIIAELLELNNKENIHKSLGNYLIGHFKYESYPYDYTGVDFETGRWFNRNLRIFRNIQRIEAKPSDKILVIFGAGHLNILNYLFECSPEYSLEDTGKYLE